MTLKSPAKEKLPDMFLNINISLFFVFIEI